MLPFSVQITSGLSVSQQLVYAVKKALVSHQLLPGDRFPSVRNLSLELRINPNTAHKAVTMLIHEGLLEVRPGIGTMVARAPAATETQRRWLLGDSVERLVVEARKLGLEQGDLLEAVRQHWQGMEDD